MTPFRYADSPDPIRQDLVRAHRDAWDHGLEAFRSRRLTASARLSGLVGPALRVATRLALRLAGRRGR